VFYFAVQGASCDKTQEYSFCEAYEIHKMHIISVYSFALLGHLAAGAMHLRQRGHDFVLPNIRYEFNKRHFIARALFDYV